MGQVNLILNIPHGSVTATSLGIEAYALHRSPGSGKHFRGNTVMVDLGLDGDRPAFRFHEEGGWRDPDGDAVAALEIEVRKQTVRISPSFAGAAPAGHEVYLRLGLDF